MSAVQGRARIDLSVAECWQKLRDLERAAHYVPGVRSVRITTDRREGVGASRRIDHAGLGRMDETVTEWKEGEGFAIRLHRGQSVPWPFAESHFRYALAPSGDGCEVTTSMSYRLRYGALGVLLDRLLMRRMLARSTRDVALALAHHYETDAPVAPKRLAELRAGARRERRASHG